MQSASAFGAPPVAPVPAMGDEEKSTWSDGVLAAVAGEEARHPSDNIEMLLARWN
jgi:hypothetical protein